LSSLFPVSWHLIGWGLGGNEGGRNALFISFEVDNEDESSL
jgi:hypothetical protein